MSALPTPTSARGGAPEVLRVLATGPDVEGELGTGVQRHIITLVSAFSGGPQASGVEVTPFSVTSTVYVEPWLLKGVRLLGRYLAFPGRARRADVVHINSTIDNRSMIRDSGFVLLARLVGRPVVFQFHGGGIHRLGAVLKQPVFGFVRSALARASVVLFLSENQGAPVAERFGLSRVRYVRNCVDTSREPVSRRGRTGLRVVFVGRLDERKGSLETIQAFSARHVQGWELHVGGAGPIETRVAELCEAAPGAEFLGFLGDEARDDVLAWGDVFALPSDHDEGLPYAALEAAAAGLALVTSDRGALPTLTRDGATGIIVGARDADSLGKAFARLAEDRALLDAMGAAARALVVAEFSFPQLREEYGSAYREAYAQRGGRP